MAQAGPELYDICPYDKSHRIRRSVMATHLYKCAMSSKLKLEKCSFNTNHRVPLEEIKVSDSIFLVSFMVSFKWFFCSVDDFFLLLFYVRIMRQVAQTVIVSKQVSTPLRKSTLFQYLLLMLICLLPMKTGMM